MMIKKNVDNASKLIHVIAEDENTTLLSIIMLMILYLKLILPMILCCPNYVRSAISQTDSAKVYNL